MIYDLTLDSNGRVWVLMSLTTPSCPVAETIPEMVRDAILSVPEVKEVDVKLTWNPPWDEDRMSLRAKIELGFI